MDDDFKTRIEEMDKAVKELEGNKCLQSAWKKVKAAAERKAERGKRSRRKGTKVPELLLELSK